MSRLNMKSELGVQAKCRPEGRIFPRRKVASKSHLLNGNGGVDFEMELSLAIQESLKYAREREEQSCEGESNESNIKNEDNENNQFLSNEDTELGNFNHGSGSDSSSAPNPMANEVGCLKDLLLSQAEFIQCQQEEILQKNKELKFLRVENDAVSRFCPFYLIYLDNSF